MVWTRVQSHEIRSERYGGFMPNKQTDFPNKLLAVGTIE